MKKNLIITAPSGAGKSTLTKRLMEHFPSIAFSISACTRSPRGTEKDGLDYYFISVDAFENKIKQHEFVEWEMVYEGKYYGTLNSELERIWDANQVPLFDIDVKGALKVKEKFGADALSIFIQAPSLEALRARLEARKTDSAAEIEERLNKAAFENSFAHQFDQVIVNDDLEKAVKEIIQIVEKFIS